MKRSRIFVYGAIASLAVAALFVVRPPLLSDLDLRVYDALLRRTAARVPTGRVAIVAADEKSLVEVGQWPWPRSIVAKLVDGLQKLGAAAVAFDMLLAEPDRLGTRPGSSSRGSNRQATTDAELATTLNGGRAVLGYAFTFDAVPREPSRCVLHPLAAVFVQGPGEIPAANRLFQATDAVCSLPALSRAAGASGFLNVGADADGILRRLPLVMTLGGELYPSLALMAVQRAQGAQQITLTSAARQPLTLSMDGRDLRLDERGTVLLRFRGRGHTFRHFSASDVLAGRLPARAFQDQIVFVGATALGVRDQIATPFDRAFPGIEVHASAADNLLERDFVARPTQALAYELLATVASGIATAALVAVGGLVWGGGAAVLSALGLFWAAAWLLEARHMFLSPLFPIAAVAVTLSGLTAAQVWHERRRAESETRRRQQADRFTVQALTSLTETRDLATGQHVRRTQTYTRLLATQLATVPRHREYLTPDRVELLANLAPLHDIGKVGIPDAVLNKPGPLTPSEYAEMKKHPQLGYDTIVRAAGQAGIDGVAGEATLDLAKDVVYTHHERWNGSGYPRGLTGEAIPVAGRIIAVVDTYDALVGRRPYHQPLPHDRAVSIIVSLRGTHFDPDVVDAFVAVEAAMKELAAAQDDAPVG